MKKNLISILTPTYNRANTFLPHTIESVRNQLGEESGTFNHEHIIIDNFSTDETEKVVRDYMKEDNRIKYVKNDHNGYQAQALNIGLKQAQGKYVLPLDDDDLLMPQSIRLHFEFMEKYPDCDFSFGHSLTIDDNNCVRVRDLKARCDNNRDAFITSLLNMNTLVNGAAILKRDCLEKVGGWDESVYCQDWDLWLRLTYNNYNYKLHDGYVGLYRVHQKRLTTVCAKDGTWGREKIYFLDKYEKFKNSEGIAETS